MELDSLGLYDIYGMYDVPFWQTQWFFNTIIAIVAIVGIVCLVTLTYVIKRFYSNRKKTPWEQALYELALLKKKSSHHEYYYDALSSIIKTYLIKRFSIDCASKTDQEVSTELSAHASLEHSKSVIAMLHRSVQAKFAKQSIAQEQCDEDFMQVTAFIQASIPQKDAK